MIDARLARFGLDTQEALGAAVIGHLVPFNLWATLLDRDEATVLEVSGEVCAAQLMEEEADGTGVRFVHALVREAVYAGVRPVRRRALHRRAGAALLALPAPDPDAVASHLVRAADPRAADWLRRAGDRAHRAYAWLTAAARYEAALALVEKGGIAPLERAWLLFRLAQLRRFVDALGALPQMQEAARLADQVGDRFLSTRAHLGMGHLLCLGGDYRRGIPQLTAGLAAIGTFTNEEHEQRGRLDPTDRSIGPGTLVVFLAVLGRYDEARAIGEPYVASAPDPETVRRADAAPHADAQAGLGLMQAALGRTEAAQQLFAQARSALRAVDHTFLVGRCAALELSRISLPYHAERLDERRTLAVEGASVGPLALIGWPDDLPSLWHLSLLVVEGRWR